MVGASRQGRQLGHCAGEMTGTIISGDGAQVCVCGECGAQE